jgi:protein ImuA
MKGLGMEQNALEHLRRQIFCLEGSRFRGGDGVVSSGCRPVDELLPEAGLHRGAVVEWLTAGAGVGASTLALLAAREASGEGGRLIVVDSRREFYPPALIRFGISAEQFLVVYTVDPADHLWALDQALRCRGVAAVLAWPEQLDGRTFRRLQLAAEEGGGLGLFVRSARVRNAPSWAETRFLVEPLPLVAAGPGLRRVRISLLRCRGSSGERSVDVEINDDGYQTHSLPLAARLVKPAAS